MQIPDGTAAPTRAGGHEEYKAWLNAVGGCFSPLFPFKEPILVGPWTSWTVEGLYQGLKLWGVEKCSLVDPAVRFEVFDPGPPSLIHLPSIMEVRDDLVHNFFFRILKSGRKYNAKRNRYLGRLDARRRNWNWTETWRHPKVDVPVGRERFREDVFVPGLRLLLSQHETEVARLKAFWEHGQHRITSNMLLAHGHLKHIEAYVNSSPP